MRTFTYSSLKRLLTASNPESVGTIADCNGSSVTASNCYSYDANGNLLTKTDARNVKTTFTYTALDQVSTKTYSDGTPSVTYTYDKDRLTKVSSPATATSPATTYDYNTFDELGRVLTAIQTTGGQTYNFTVSHYPFMGVNAITYPGGRKMTTSYDSGGRAQSLSGLMGANTTNYVTSVGYAPQGAIQQLSLNNGLTERTCFNARLQPVNIRVAAGAQDCTPASTDLLNLAYNYGTTANNGNVQSQTITRGAQPWAQSYGYDAANRLTCANEVASATALGCGTGAPSWLQTYNFDTRGNRWLNSIGPVAQTAELIVSNAFNGANRISAWDSPTCYNSANCYDPAGNLKAVPATGGAAVRTANYDAENRMTSATAGATTTNYAYDGDGRRVRKTAGSAVTTFVYDPFGRLAQEYGAATDTNTKYLHTDTLGSTRLLTKGDGSVDKCYDYLPFGEEINSGTAARANPCFGGTNVISTKFTSKERDAETGLDFFGARYMSSAQGRFTSPDVPLLDQREDDPQSWNLYSYGRNNPLRYTDPTGNCTVDGEQHFGSCIWHTLGFYETKKEQAAATQKEADSDRTAMGQWHGFSINGQTPADIAKNGTNEQVIGAYKSGMGFLTGVAMQSLSPCAPGVACGVIPIGPLGAEIEGVEVGAQSEITNITRGGSVVNIRTNVAVDEFGKNLESNGFVKSAARDGTPQYTKGNTQYTVYPKSTSTGEATAQVKVNGVVVEKIRLK